MRPPRWLLGCLELARPAALVVAVVVVVGVVVVLFVVVGMRNHRRPDCARHSSVARAAVKARGTTTTTTTTHSTRGAADSASGHSRLTLHGLRRSAHRTDRNFKFAKSNFEFQPNQLHIYRQPESFQLLAPTRTHLKFFFQITHT